MARFSFKKQFAAVALLALGTGNASAVCCGDGAIAAAGAISAGATVSAAIATSTMLLINEIAGDSMSAAKVVVSGVSAAITQSSEMITENDNKLTTRVRAVETMRRRRIQDPCIMIAATKAPAIAATAAISGSSYGRGGSGASAPGNSLSGGSGPASTANIIGIARGDIPSPSTDILATNAARWACGEYSAGKQLRRAACEGAGLNPGNGGQRPDADIRAETLYDGPQESAGTTKLRRTIAADGKDRQAMEAFLRNISSPLELRQLEKAELKTDDGRRFLALKDVYEARMSMATRPLRDLAANKTENAATIPGLQAMLKSDSTKAYVNGRLSAIPGWSSKGVSPEEMRALEAERRHMNPAWREFLAKASEQEIEMEKIQIMAYQVVLQTQQLEEMGKLRAEVSNLTATSVRNEMLPQLLRQHTVATR